MKTCIIVGDALPEYNCDVLPGNRMPKEVRKYVESRVDEENKKLDFVVIRTYTDTIINLVGELIEEGTIAHDSVFVHVDGKSVYYNGMGYLKEGWPFGTFNY